MLNMSAERHDYCGEEAVTLSAGRYTAMVLPNLGGNLVSFKDTEHDLSFIRTPKADEMEAFKADPVVYGIPVLFPPNRYEDGMFTWNGRTYSFPINEEKTHNHLHGFLTKLPWDVSDIGFTETEAYIELVQNVDDAHPMNEFFPHQFTMTIRYVLSDAGLEQKVRIDNNGIDAMPLMLGFHTTLNVPFSTNSNEADYMFTTTIGERWQMSDRMLPTGKHQELTTEEIKMKDFGVSPFFNPLDNHYTAAPQGGVNRTVLTDNRLGVNLVYDVGLKYRNWMIFNNYGRGQFFCPEPQTSVVNAPNTGLSNHESGLIALQPGDSWSESSRFYVESWAGIGNSYFNHSLRCL